MVSAALLHSLRKVGDLPRVPEALGYAPAWDELPSGALLPAETLVVIARQGEFAWYGAAGNHALVRRAARALAGRGIPGVIAGIDAGARELAVAAESGRPLTVSLDAPDPVALSRLGRLAMLPGEQPLATVCRIRDALDGRAVDQRFFAGFRRALDAVMGSFAGRIPNADRHGLGLLLLTRILFLYFIEAKGWLGGRPRFIREEVDRCLGARRSLHRQLLQPLFFGTLNRPACDRSALARRFGAIPFLNGGLFEPHPLERRWRVTCPTPVLRSVFDALFEKFHFTIHNVPCEAVAPDMLGRVFEGVMDPDERHDSGSFYTPGALVDDLLRDALATWLSPRLAAGFSEARSRLHSGDPAVRRELAGLALLDPAAGSGAFLVGALRLLAGPADAGPRRHAARLRRVLRRSLYGVDRNAVAVRLAELRLWLEVVAADPGERAAAVQPLPNLDAMVRQGDTLHNPPGTPLPHLLPTLMRRELTRLREAVVDAAGRAKPAAVRALRTAELRAARAALDQDFARSSAAIEELLGLGKSSTLFGERRGLDRRELDALRSWRARARNTRARLRELSRAESVPWFSIGTQFADVLSRGGFDLVVGNPPWVRSESLAPDVRQFLAERFRWMRSASGAGGYSHRPDLSVAFLERALELVTPGGVVAFLLPAKIASTGYAAAAREALARQTTITLAAPVSDHPAAGFDATVYPMALAVTNAAPPDGHRVRTRLGAPPGSLDPAQSSLGGQPWRLGAGPARQVIERLEQVHPRLGDRFRCQLGVKTGLNRVFLDPDPDVEEELLRWAVRGRDVKPFRVERVKRLLWPCDDTGRALAVLPPRAARALAPHLGVLRRRADHNRGVPWTLYRTGPASAPHRVVWSDLARSLAAVALTGMPARRVVPLNTCYVVAMSDGPTALRLAAWLNSTWSRVIAAASAEPASGGFSRFNARVVAALPLPTAALSSNELLIHARAGAAATLRQADLDDSCAGLLGLTGRDRDILAALAPPDRDARRGGPGPGP